MTQQKQPQKPPQRLRKQPTYNEETDSYEGLDDVETEEGESAGRFRELPPQEEEVAAVPGATPVQRSQAESIMAMVQNLQHGGVPLNPAEREQLRGVVVAALGAGVGRAAGRSLLTGILGGNKKAAGAVGAAAMAGIASYLVDELFGGD